MWYSSESLDGKDGQKSDEVEEEFDDYLGVKHELQPQGVDPKRGWNFRGVHKVFNVTLFSN